MKAIILDFLYGQTQWQKRDVYARIRTDLRKEIDCASNRQSLKGLCRPMRLALDSPNFVHIRFRPKSLTLDNLACSARRKISSLPISKRSWANDLIVIIPPWNPTLELALVEAIELNPSISSTIPIAVSGLKYRMNPDVKQDCIDIDCFHLRLSYFIADDGQMKVRRGYTDKKATLSVPSTV